MHHLRKNVWIVTELYYPEQTSTGYVLTRIAEGLADGFKVKVLCSQPTYSARGRMASVRELHNGVEIHRCRGTRLDKDSWLGRICNMLTITVSICLNAVLRFREGDCALVVTNPPLLPFAIYLACALRRTKLVPIIHDVYPDALVAAGLTHRGSLVARMLDWMNRRVYRNASRVVVLGRDMRELVERKAGTGRTQIELIENWAETDSVRPAPRAENTLLAELGLGSRFVVQYAGNMGRTHGLEHLISCASALAVVNPRIHFLFIGSGAKRGWVEEQVKGLDLSNVTVAGSRLRLDQQTLLTGCDLAVISYLPGMAGVSVPSRMYNIMAAGKPILAVADPNSELAQVVNEERIGWVVAPGDQAGLIASVLEGFSDPGALITMGERARQAAEGKYRPERAIGAYFRLVQAVLSN